jgi:hypothetical protein
VHRLSVKQARVLFFSQQGNPLLFFLLNSQVLGKTRRNLLLKVNAAMPQCQKKVSPVSAFLPVVSCFSLVLALVFYNIKARFAQEKVNGSTS